MMGIHFCCSIGKSKNLKSENWQFRNQWVVHKWYLAMLIWNSSSEEKLRCNGSCNNIVKPPLQRQKWQHKIVGHSLLSDDWHHYEWRIISSTLKCTWQVTIIKRWPLLREAIYTGRPLNKSDFGISSNCTVMISISCMILGCYSSKLFNQVWPYMVKIRVKSLQ